MSKASLEFLENVPGKEISPAVVQTRYFLAMLDLLLLGSGPDVPGFSLTELIHCVIV